MSTRIQPYPSLTVGWREYQEHPTHAPAHHIDQVVRLERLLRALPAVDCEFINNVLVELRDPVSRLPPEVVLRIFDFLHPFYGWSLRIISRRWNAFLASERAIQAQLAKFEAHGSLYSALRPNAQRVERSRIRHIQALRLGRPFTFCEVKDQLAIPLGLTTKDRAVQEYGICKSTIAYLRGAQHQSSTIVLHDITSGMSRTFSGGARERLMGLALSQDLLVYANFSGFLYVEDLNDPDKGYQVRLPSSNIEALVADDKMVAILLRNTATTSTIVLHEQNWRQTSSFSFTHQSDPGNESNVIRPQSILLDAYAGHIDVFGSSTTKRDTRRDALWVGHMRFQLSGQLIRKSIIECDEFDLSAWGPEAEQSSQLEAVQYIGRPGLFNIPMVTRHSYGDFHGMWSIIFDAAAIQLHQPGFDYETILLSNSFGGSCSHQLIWKGCGYGSNPHEHLSAVRLAKSAVKYGHSVGSIRIDRPEDRPSGDGSEGQPSALAMNDSFIVRFAPYSQSILIMCFDEDVIMADAKPTGLWAGSPQVSTHVVAPETVQRGHRSLKKHRDDVGFRDNGGNAQQWQNIRRSMPGHYNTMRGRGTRSREDRGEDDSEVYRGPTIFDGEFGRLSVPVRLSQV